MDIIHIGSCQFTDNISGESSFMIVKLAENSIGLGLSLEEDGDAEVFLDMDKCQQLIEWLSIALAKAKSISAG